MSYPDVVIALQHHKVFPVLSGVTRAALVKHDNNMKDYSLVAD